MIIDWNRETLKRGQVFHFANSLRPFVEIYNTNNNTLFLDVDKMIAYDFDELEYEGLDFYRKEDDDDFLGVDTDGHLEWVG
jgi:hypothetical protein